MKYPMVILAGLALAGCNTTTAPTEPAQITQGKVGINFAAMPVGTQAHYRASNGDRWVEVYRGKNGKFHQMDTIFGGDRITLSNFYLDDGTLARREYLEGRLEGNVRTFSPRRCTRVLGDCSFTAINTKPQRTSVDMMGNTTQSGNSFTYTFGPTDGSSQRTFVYTLGQFNLITSAKSGDYSETLTKLVTP